MTNICFICGCYNTINLVYMAELPTGIPVDLASMYVGLNRKATSAKLFYLKSENWLLAEIKRTINE